MSTQSQFTSHDEYLTGGDGLRLFVRSWFPTGVPLGILVICHGFLAHSGHYKWVAERAVEAGYGVYAIDLRGRGRSEGERFFVSEIDDYVSDLAQAVSLAYTRHVDLPVFLIGHSAGGVVSAVYALRHQNLLSGLICESFAYRVPAPRIALSLFKLLARVIPKVPVLKLKTVDFSRDPVAVAALDSDPLITGEVQPLRTVAALVHGGDELQKGFPQISLPLLILHGTADKATLPAGSEEFFQRAGSVDKTLKLYDGHFHDLLQDIGREQVMSDILGWIGQHVPVQTGKTTAG
ncbi:lysophospholipase [Pleomorphomonas sp. PLEO]|uniref:alpha/beta hydrolase n=1 Tax=Pleomorphomonas sp. PLEO TaxID=3239306 RepID=UPI00351DE82C